MQSGRDGMIPRQQHRRECVGFRKWQPCVSNEIIGIRADDIDDDDDGDVNKLNLKTSVHYIFGSPHQTEKKLYISLRFGSCFQAKENIPSWKFLNTQGQFCTGGGGCHIKWTFAHHSI